jgi:hypothetical protein
LHAVVGRGIVEIFQLRSGEIVGLTTVDYVCDSGVKKRLGVGFVFDAAAGRQALVHEIPVHFSFT